MTLDLDLTGSKLTKLTWPDLILAGSTTDLWPDLNSTKLSAEVTWSNLLRNWGRPVNFTLHDLIWHLSEMFTIFQDGGGGEENPLDEGAPGDLNARHKRYALQGSRSSITKCFKMSCPTVNWLVDRSVVIEFPRRAGSNIQFAYQSTYCILRHSW